MKSRPATIWMVVVCALAAGCQSKTPPPTVHVALDQPSAEDVVEFYSLEVITETRWTSANRFAVNTRLPESHVPAIRDGKICTIDEVRLSLNGGGSWFRDRFGLKLAVKGHWQANKDDDAYFAAEKFVTYSNGVEFKPNDPKARDWLEDQVRGLWRDVLKQVRNAR